MNIRSETDRTTLLAKGYKWATVASRGDTKGTIRSKHKAYHLANKAARNTDRTIVDINDGHTF